MGDGLLGDIRLRAAASAYLMFILMFAVPIGICVVAAVKESSMWTGVLILVVLLVSLLFYLYRLEVVVSQGALTYQKLIGRSSLALTDISRSEFKWVQKGRGAQPCLVVQRVQGGKPLIINLKPFRRDDIARLLSMSELRLGKRDHVA